MSEEKKETEERENKKEMIKPGFIGSAAFVTGFAAASNLVNNFLPPQKVNEEITEEETDVYVCPFEDITFETYDDYRTHFLQKHRGQELIKKPKTREVEDPIYTEIQSSFSRVDQKNNVLSRSRWDEDFRDALQEASGVSSKPDGDWMAFTELKGQKEHDGGIYTDSEVGNFNYGSNYNGYEGHLREGGGLWGWSSSVNNKEIKFDPEIASSNVKRMAEFYGADLIGITEINDDWVYSNYYDRSTQKSGELSLEGDPAPESETNISYDYAIVMAVEMDWDLIKNSPNWEATTESAISYSEIAKLADRLASYIRGLGYAAVPSGDDTTQSIPLAIDAGLGQIGRNGLLITPDHGPRVRLCKVYTNLPLKADKPIDFGMREYCNNCQECADGCPVDAIQEGDFGLGEIDSESCLTYWVENGVICANCIKDCPWSQPDFNRGDFGFETSDDSGGES